ncbi:MAG TPA: hypothetical protein PK004_02275, partial [Smithella sp.]|nr:hypothetical protein [Smithella sp.]HQP40247.1 hypothetical protein [Smithella sp.]
SLTIKPCLKFYPLLSLPTIRRFLWVINFVDYHLKGLTTKLTDGNGAQRNYTPVQRFGQRSFITYFLVKCFPFLPDQ